MKKENVKSTTKCLQYDMTMTLIDELQQANLWIFKLFFVIGDILICKPIVKFITSLAPLFKKKVHNKFFLNVLL